PSLNRGACGRQTGSHEATPYNKTFGEFHRCASRYRPAHALRLSSRVPLHNNKISKNNTAITQVPLTPSAATTAPGARSWRG
ncbi:hypothetical protein LBW59_25645, partial [Ralstonia solanacearum]